jgi:hypothetical protein
MAVGYASQLLPIFKYYARTITIASTNDTITFGEGGGALTASIENGTWTYGELAWKVKVALEAAGAGNYTVTYVYSTRCFTFTKSAGTFTLDAGATADDLLPSMGITVDKSGALTYTGSAVPSQTTVTCTQRIRDPQIKPMSQLDVTRADSGRRESCQYGTTERLAFRIEFETVAVAQAIYDMWNTAAKFGDSIDLYPDSTDGTNYVTVYWDAPEFPGRQTPRGLYRLWDFEFALEIAVPAAGTYTLRDFIDRRPTS